MRAYPLFPSLIAVLLIACSGGAKAPPGKVCLMNSECQSPLICTFGKCHAACAEARDCPTGQLCVKSALGAVCQLPGETSCRSGAECQAPLTCAPDGVCRTDCSSDSSCPTPTQKCLPDRICAEPDEIDLSGARLKNAPITPGSGPDGGADAGPTPDAGAPADMAPAGGCSPGATMCVGKKPSTCMNGLWVTANSDCEQGCDTTTGACRVCPTSTCRSVKVIFHGAIDGNPDVQLAVDDGKTYRTASDTDAMIGTKNALFGNFTEDRKQYTTDNTACSLPDFGKRTNIYYLAPVDSLTVAGTWYSSAVDYASADYCQSCPNFGCGNFISTPKRIDKIEVSASSGDLTCKVCLYKESPASAASLVRCVSPNTTISGPDLAPMTAPVVLQLDDGKRCAAY